MRRFYFERVTFNAGYRLGLSKNRVLRCWVGRETAKGMEEEYKALQRWSREIKVESDKKKN